MTDFYSQNRCVCSTRSHGPLLCAFCLSFHFNGSVVAVPCQLYLHYKYNFHCSIPYCNNSRLRIATCKM